MEVKGDESPKSNESEIINLSQNGGELEVIGGGFWELLAAWLEEDLFDIF